MNSANPEDKIPKIKSEASPFGKQLINLILIKIFRPDKFNPIAYQLVKVVLGEECREDFTVDFKSVILACKSKEPILLSSAPGFDPSFKVEQLSKESNIKLHSVAIGSA
jgi:dynein heavy chain 1